MSEISNVRTQAARIAETGFSIVELIIAMVIFMIVTGIVFGTLQVAMKSRTVVTESTQVNKNVRVAMNVIGRDTYNAGFGYPLKNTVVLPDNRITTLLGIPVDFDNTRDTVPPIIVGNNTNLNTYNPVANTRTDQITLLFKDTSFNLVGPAGSEVSTPININAATTTSGIDQIVPLSGSNAACRVNDIYLISGNTGSTIGLATALTGGNTVQFANGDVLGINQTGTAGPLRSITTPATLQRVFMVTYFVTTDGTLTRREFANDAPVAPAVGQSFVDEPLVYGVEDLQIRYIMDDGTVTDNPSAGPNGIPGDADDTQALLAAIRQIRFTVSVRSVELNAANQPYRSTMTTTYSTRNLGYDAN
jgi:type II secretory pathway pseudopilin PulG